MANANYFPTAWFPDGWFPASYFPHTPTTGFAGMLIPLTDLMGVSTQMALIASPRPGTLITQAGLNAAIGLLRSNIVSLQPRLNIVIGLSFGVAIPTITTHTQWLLNNYFDKGVTAISTNVGIASSLYRLKDTRRSVQTTFLGTGNVQITADLGSGQNIQCVAFCGNNLRLGATVQVRYSSDNFVSTDTLIENISIIRPTPLTGGQVLEFPHFSLFSTISARYWRLVLNDIGNPDGVLRMGRIYIGPTTQFTPEIDPQFGIVVTDPSVSQRTAGGTLYADQQAAAREFTLSYSYLTDADVWDNLLSIAQQIGMSTDIWLILQPAAMGAKRYQSTVYGRLTALPSLTHQFQSLWNTKQLVILESL